jgi:hypothetical protein
MSLPNNQMKNIRMAALNNKRKTNAIKRKTGKSKNANPVNMPTNIKKDIPTKNSFMRF